MAPVYVPEVDIARGSAVPGQIGMIEHIVIEAVGGQCVAVIIGLINRPVVSQPFWAQNQNTVVAQLMILDDRERLECFPKSYTVGNDTATKTIELVDGTNDPITLEFVEFFPDQRIPDARCGFNNLVFVEFVSTIFKDVVEDQGVHAVRILEDRQ